MKPLFLYPAFAVLVALPASASSARQGTAGAAATASEASAVSCSRLNVNGRKPGESLTVSVNGATVGTFSGEAGVYQDLEPRMKTGVNQVRLSFAAPGEPGPFGTEAELRCLAPGAESSRDTILRLQPTAKRLTAETEVNYVPR
jgi:hypothetical protein